MLDLALFSVKVTASVLHLHCVAFDFKGSLQGRADVHLPAFLVRLVAGWLCIVAVVRLA